MKIQSLQDLETIGREYQRWLYTPDTVKVNVGMASCGIAAGAQAAYDEALKQFPGDNGVKICQTGCIGFCEQEPLVEILASDQPRVIYQNLSAKKIVEAIEGYRYGEFTEKQILGQMKDPRSLLEDDFDNPLSGVTPINGIPAMEDVPFYGKQIKVAMRNCGYIDPDSIEEYMARRGYAAFLNALQEMAPSEIIEVVKRYNVKSLGLTFVNGDRLRIYGVNKATIGLTNELKPYRGEG